MNKKLSQPKIAGLEIGSTKISIIIGNILINNTIEIISFQTYPIFGIKNGNINNLELFTKNMIEVIKTAEETAKFKINFIYLSLSYKNIISNNEIGTVPIKNKEVTQIDINNAIKTAKSIKIENNYKIMHIAQQEYSIDNQLGIKNPIGLSGIRMQANIHIIMCDKIFEENIIKAIEKCGILVKKVICSGLASSEAVLTQKNKKSGICLVDIGASNMNINIYIHGYLVHSSIIPYAGNSVTNDISYAFSLSYSKAEYIKKKYGSVIKNIPINNQIIEIPNEQEKKITNQELYEVIEPRYHELLNLIKQKILETKKEIKKKGLKFNLSDGITLTGGGSKIKFLQTYAEKLFKTKVFIRKPKNILGISKELEQPEQSAIIGLLFFGKKYYEFKEKNKKKIGFYKFCIKKIYKWFKK